MVVAVVLAVVVAVVVVVVVVPVSRKASGWPTLHFGETQRGDDGRGVAGEPGLGVRAEECGECGQLVMERQVHVVVPGEHPTQHWIATTNEPR